MRPHDARTELARLVATSRDNFRSLSIMLGRNPAYLQQYVKRGSPASLGKRDRQILADYLGVSEDLLSDDPRPRAVDIAGKTVRPGLASDRPNLIIVPRLDVEASAGPGAVPTAEAKLGHYGFDRQWLHHLSPGSPDRLSIGRVKGDSMAPTLIDGDDILVEQLDAGGRVRDGIFVLQRDDTLLVKRIAIGRSPGKLDVLSDNSAYPSWPDCDVGEVSILGRVIWSARRQS